MLNGASAYGSLGSFAPPSEDRGVKSMPWILRNAVPGFRNGWPA
jgi:hypothetical protein